MKHKRKTKWWPGIYEGKSPEETQAQVGTQAPVANFPGQRRTPDDFLWQRLSQNLSRHTTAKY